MGTVKLRGPLTRNGNWEELGGVMVLNWENGEEGIGVALLGILSFVFAERDGRVIQVLRTLKTGYLGGLRVQ